ncbi:MAG: NADPH-dependent F420 reductase [Chloroflexota bacterium]
MNIAIIGSGNVGLALASAFTQAGHAVRLTARHSEKAQAVASETGARWADSNVDAAAQADLVVLAIPFANAEAVAAEIRDAVAGKPVIDVSNRMAFGADGPTIDSGPSNAERLAGWLPEASVVKAFNTVFASNQVDPNVEGIQLDGFVAADDPAAKATVLELVDSIGLRAIDAGPLGRAQQLEQLAFLNIALNATNGWSWQSGWRLAGAPTAVPSPA